MFEIVKRIEFCFGHRLIDYQGKCNRPHGHNGLAEIRLASESLDELGMVADFGDVGDAVEEWIDANLDHRMILRRDDPLIRAIAALGQESFEVDENPTAENMAKLIFSKVRELGFPVVDVTLWETPDSSATYAPEASQARAGDGTAGRKKAPAAPA